MVLRPYQYHAVEAIEDLSDEAIDDLVSITPKDTGTTAANWNSDNQGTNIFEESRVSPKANADKQKSKHKILAEDAVRNGRDIVFSNPAPNIFGLERGDSSQAPTGMVETTITRMKARRSM